MPESRHAFRIIRTSCLVGVVLMLAGVVLVGCQSAMSVEEAKKVSVAFSGRRFVPPPRTVQDIIDLLDRQQLDNPQAVAEARGLVDQTAPKAPNAAALADFYLRRGLAARELGRTKQEIDDLTQAAQLMRRVNVSTYLTVLFELGRAERTSGNLDRAADYFRQVIAATPATERGWLIFANGFLVRINAWLGNFEAAGTAFQELQTAYKESFRWEGVPPGRRAAWDAFVAMAQAVQFEAKGQFDKAEQFRRKSVDALDDSNRNLGAVHPAVEGGARDTPGDILRSELGLLLAKQGRLVEAEVEVRKALLSILRKQGRNAGRPAIVLSDLTRVVAEQGRHAEAEILARAVLDIYRKIGAPADGYTLVLARDQLGAILAAQERWLDTLFEYEALRRDLEADSAVYRRYFAGNVNWALALVKTGRAEQAMPIIQQALEDSRRAFGEIHTNTAEIHGLIGMAYSAKGELAKAVAEFKSATDVLLYRSLAVDDETTTRPMRDQRLTLILESYIGVLATLKGTPLERQLGLDAAAEAFRLADVARGRAVQTALDAAAARATAQTPALADLVRKEQDARKQLSALYVTLSNALGTPSAQQDAKSLNHLRSDIETLRRARETLAKEIDAQFPAYGALVNPQPATVEQIRVRLRPGEVVIATLVTRERTFVWAVPQAGAVVFAVSPVGEKPLAEAVAKIRKSVDAAGIGSVGDIPRFNLYTAHEVYRQILEPVVVGWEPASHLLVVGHGPLGHLPFALLPRKPAELPPEQEPLFSNYRTVPWLIKTHAVTVLPSVTALATLRSLPAAQAGRKPFVGFGDPYFSVEQARRAHEPRTEPIETTSATGVPSRSRPLTVRNVVASPTDGIASSQLGGLPRLPDTADEIRGIAAAMNADVAADVFLGERANVRTVKTMDLTGYRVVAFATHGLVPGDLDGLTQPALALSAPEVTKIEGDGLLTMQDILGLRLNADWVVLSACNTANGNGAGAEAISGLGRAFFYAGARAVLVTNWPVETTSARMLTTALFKRQSEQPALTRARALQQTLNALIDDGGLIDRRTGKMVFSYAHPIFWAPFVLVGDGG